MLTLVTLLGAIIAPSPTAQPAQGGAAPRAETYQVKDYRVSIVKTERAKEWKDTILGDQGRVVRAAAGEEILLITLRIEAPGRVELKGLSAVSTDGRSYRCVFLEIGESRFTADGKPSAVTFERVLPFVVPAGTEFAKLVLEGVDVPVARVGKR